MAGIPPKPQSKMAWGADQRKVLGHFYWKFKLCSYSSLFMSAQKQVINAQNQSRRLYLNLNSKLFLDSRIKNVVEYLDLST